MFYRNTTPCGYWVFRVLIFFWLPVMVRAKGLSNLACDYFSGVRTLCSQARTACGGGVQVFYLVSKTEDGALLRPLFLVRAKGLSNLACNYFSGIGTLCSQARTAYGGGVQEFNLISKSRTERCSVLLFGAGEGT